MNVIERTSIVPYSARQMFELVNNVEDYPRFLPWCHDSKIVSQTDKEIIASLNIVWKGIHKQITTRNLLQPYHRIEIDLVQGPLRRLDGIWTFESLNEGACKVILDLEFEFSGSFLDMLFQPVFHHIANTFVDAFCKRATELYG